MTVFDRISCGYDLGMLPLELLILGRLRRQVFPYLVDQVLEIGVGTGVNLPLYGDSVDLVAIDSSVAMLDQARRRPTRAQVHCLAADAAHMPFAAGSFDRVVGSLVFCSIDHPREAFGEIRRVLREDGWLILLEHVRGSVGLGRWLTDTLAGPWLRLSESCHLDRETTQAAQDAGFRIVCVRRHLLGVVRIVVARRE